MAPPNRFHDFNQCCNGDTRSLLSFAAGIRSRQCLFLTRFLPFCDRTSESPMKMKNTTRNIGTGFLFLLLLTHGVMACDETNSPIGGGGSGANGGSGGSGGTGGSGGSGGSGGQTPRLGTTFDCSNASNETICEIATTFSNECISQGGFYDYCNNVKCSYLPQCDVTLCHPPPPAPSANEFACTWLNCQKGQICVFNEPLGDGCSMHSCVNAPAACAQTPTCACLKGIGCVDCTEDAQGNVTIKGLNAVSCVGG